MASQKIIAVLLVCLVLVAAIHVAEGGLETKEKEYKKCLEDCETKCEKENSRSFCEQKCDEDCENLEDKVHLAEAKKQS